MTPQIAQQLDRMDGVPTTFMERMRSKVGLMPRVRFRVKPLMLPDEVVPLRARLVFRTQSKGANMELWHLRDGRFLFCEPGPEDFGSARWHIVDAHEIGGPGFRRQLTEMFQDSPALPELFEVMGIRDLP